ncbi:MAG: hypothetical protein QM756_37530 [Polyangiaceae bacterium]
MRLRWGGTNWTRPAATCRLLLARPNLGAPATHSQPVAERSTTPSLASRQAEARASSSAAAG